ncbi:hypothetical protein LINGRAHAP2_LOCUS4048 [Linum grandiflorum]
MNCGLAGHTNATCPTKTHPSVVEQTNIESTQMASQAIDDRQETTGKPFGEWMLPRRKGYQNKNQGTNTKLTLEGNKTKRETTKCVVMPHAPHVNSASPECVYAIVPIDQSSNHFNPLFEENAEHHVDVLEMQETITTTINQMGGHAPQIGTADSPLSLMSGTQT